MEMDKIDFYEAQSKQFKDQTRLLATQEQHTVIKPVKQVSSSEFLDAYTSYIGPILSAQQTKKLEQILKAKNIMIDKTNFTSSLLFEIIESDLQSYTLLLHYGIYKLKVSILMTKFTDAYFVNQVIISSGNYGNVYLVNLSQKSYTIKRIFIKSKSFDSELQKIYQEYFLCYIASILKVGPKIYNVFGYDIVITQNSAFFAMELCQNYTIQRRNQLKRHCIDNLRILHAIKFLHLDIKPDNLAYSVSYKKCVFIDFGFSILIQNEIGFKNLSGFVGTLAFCSQEMKSIYFLGKSKFVDLYYNDCHSLKKTLNKIKDLPEQNSNSSRLQHILYEDSNQLSILSQSVQILRLKFHLFLNNADEVKKILPSLATLPNIYFAVLNNKTTQRFINNNENIQQFIAQVRNQITSLKSQKNSTDHVVSQAFVKMNQDEGRYELTLSQKLLCLPSAQLWGLFQNEVFIQNILLYFEDFSSQNNINEEKQNKIIKLLKKVNQIEKHESSSQLYEQIWHFLIFLNNNLKKKRNYKFLSILRVLFIRLEDFKSIQPLEDEMINLVICPIQKCLLIAQFILFWEIYLNTLKYYKIVCWKQQIQKVKDVVHNQALFTKIKQFSLTLLTIINKRFYEPDFINNLYRIIQQCLLDDKQKQYHEKIQVIKVLYLQFYKIEKKFMKNNILQIYSVYFPSEKNLKQSNLTSFQKIFTSQTKQLQKYDFMNSPEKNDKKLQNAIRFIFKKIKGRPDLINVKFFQILLKNGQSKKVLALFFDIFTQNFEILCNKFQIFSQFQMCFTEYMTLNLFLFIQTNIYFPIKRVEQKLNQSQLEKLKQKIGHIIHLYDQKFNQLFPYMNRKDMNSFILCQRLIKLKFKILNKQMEQIQKEVQQIFPHIHFDNFDYDYDRVFFTYCGILEELIDIFPKNKKKAIESIIIGICQSQIESQCFELFQKQLFISSHYLRINMERNQFYKNRALIQRLILVIEENKKFEKKYYFENSFIFILQNFCHFASPFTLKTLYDQISFKKEQLSRKCYPLYVLIIFNKLYPEWHSQKEIMIRQLKRSCLCLPKMFTIHALKARLIILSLCRLPKILQSKRKRLKCERMLLQSMGLEGISECEYKLLKSRIKSIHNTRIKQYILRKKIFRQENKVV